MILVLGRAFCCYGSAHQLPDAVEHAYQRGSQFTKRVALMAEWAVYCSTVSTDAVVKPIRGASTIDYKPTDWGYVMATEGITEIET